MGLNELKMLLALNGNQRLSHLEAEIFTREELYKFYLECISNKYEWYWHYVISANLPWLAYKYSMCVIKGRWSEAEGLIRSVPTYKRMYNIFLIKLT
jgi:hypothetical protein